MVYLRHNIQKIPILLDTMKGIQSIKSIHMNWIYMGLVGLPLIAWGMFWIHATRGKHRISDKELVQAWKSGNIWGVVDVRTTTEWNQGHFPDAVHLPIQDIRTDHPIMESLRQESRRIQRENPTSEKSPTCLLVYCRTGNRARYAVEQMKKLLPEYTCIVYTTLTYENIERVVRMRPRV